MTTIEKFCDQHDACREGRNWALAQGVTMAELWKLDMRPDWRIWIATRPDVLDDRTLRLFSIYCARSVQHLMKDQRSINSIDVAERYAHGHATDAELAAAMDAATGAAMDAVMDAVMVATRAARYAARVAAMDAVMDAAMAALDAARYAARAARYAARYAAMAAGDAAMEDFANWLINTTPNFEGEES